MWAASLAVSWSGAIASAAGSEVLSEMQLWVPEDALVAAAWTGFHPDRPTDPTTTSLLDEPEVRAFGLALEKLIFQLAGMDGSDDAETASQIARGLLQQPGALYVRTPETMTPSGVRAGMVVGRSEQTEVWAQFLRTLAEGAPTQTRVRIGDADLTEFQLGDFESITFGPVGETWVLAVGAGEMQRWLEQPRQTPAPWITEVEERFELPSAQVLVSLDIAGCVSLVRQSPADLEEFNQAWALSGLDAITRVTVLLGNDAAGYHHRTWIATPAGRTGVLAGLGNKGLPEDALPPLPHSLAMGLVVDADASRSASEFFAAAERLDPAFAQRLASDYQAAAESLGIDTEGMADSLGSPWVVYHSPVDGGWISGFAAIVPLKDPRPWDALQTKMAHEFQERAQGQGFFSPRYVSATYLGETIHAVRNWRISPFDLSWCVTDDYLLLAVSPTAIKPMLERIKQGGPFPVPLRLADERAGVVGALDLKSLLGTPRGLGQILLSVMEWEFMRSSRGEGRANLAASLPPGSLIERHLREDRVTLIAEAEGLRVEGEFTVPGSEFALAAIGIPVLAELMEETGFDPRILVAPRVVQEKESIQNLKMLGLAMHNYHDTFNGLPPAFSVDAKGQPLLSWRVHVLPYLEQAALYEQFHLDEPWNSEHNLKLVEQMPAVFRAPGSQAEAGKTVYLTPRTPQSLFPGKPEDEAGRRGIRFAQVTDGLSNTLMVVEANDASAVVWTKPDDWVPDMVQMKQLIGLRKEAFLGVMGDGFARRFPEALGEETLKALITRNGGEIADFD